VAEKTTLPDKSTSAEKDAAYFVKQLKDFVGLGDIDQSAQWIKLTYHDRRINRVVYRGSVAVSVRQEYKL